MLSRIAESLFWIGRYLERADGTARILDVQLQLLLEDPWVDEDTACRALLGVMGSVPPPGAPIDRDAVLSMLAANRQHPASIAYCLYAARENARRAREIVSSELWECLNTTTRRMPKQIANERAHDFFHWVRERTALAVGTNETVMSRDDAYHFFTLGLALERADMTARLLATRALTDVSGPSWTTILRSCGAYEPYLRTYRGASSLRNAAEFLLIDRVFPRSVLFSISQAADSLAALEPRHNRLGAGDPASRVLGQAIASLEYRPMPEILADLPGAMGGIQRATGAASAAITQRYFPSQVVPTWAGDRV
ncbi:alpha-E domain-containing protein [Gryllotalpicola reticulitermitis]|uniref:Alpha-E domain-containing protein n=1 Tax=Gryllotalpicola reticulitermitis TaxID=1184153 RepID=A0ABV8Q731_9MICO